MKSIFYKKKWGNREFVQVQNLADFLTPEDRHVGDCGRLEDIKYQLDECRKVVGKLLAIMVEREIVSLDHAFQAVGLNDTLEIVVRDEG